MLRSTQDTADEPDIEISVGDVPDPGAVATALLDAADTMVVVADRDATIVYVNPAFTAVTGYSREEAIGSSCRLLRSGVQDDAFYAEMWQTILAGRTWHGELINRRKDGTLYADEMTIVPVGPEPARHFVAIKRDLSTRTQPL
ncbi:MAG TPA: PAS domain-containing protein, partial [Acidimicrobiia bacterium]|nr:PAS domain-containing protein [Acidimicrobiia bacterium]